MSANPFWDTFLAVLGMGLGVITVAVVAAAAWITLWLLYEWAGYMLPPRKW